MSSVIIRQGDVLLQPVEEIGSQLIEAPRDRDGAATIAHGEVTGHRHRLELEAGPDGTARCRLYEHPEAPGEVTRVLLTTSQPLLHEEHGAHMLTCGLWRVSRPYEYEGAELIRPVED